MKYRIFRIVLIIFAALMAGTNLFGQTLKEQVYSIDELFSLAIENNKSLKLSSGSVDIARQRIEVAKTQQRPYISAALSVAYLGDATIYDPDFANKIDVKMPHLSNSFTLQATQMIFKGNSIDNSIELASLQHQLAALNFDKNKQDIKLLISGYYFDMFRLRNQKQIYQRNIELSELRLKNIQKMYEQGLVNNNDVIRTKLLVSNYKLALLQIDDNIDIINKQLATAAGLPGDVAILPDTAILANKPVADDYEQFKSQALANNYDLQASKMNVQIAEKGLAITQGDLWPTISLFAANSLTRPITTRTPALDMYSNGWQAGISLSYNISSLYNSGKNIDLSRMQVIQSENAVAFQKQNTELAVHAQYLKYTEAVKQWETTVTNLQLAQENYKITETKYLNQLAILIDMLDATNAKLDSELQQTNSEINIIFSYYKLLSVIGKL